MIKNVGFKVSHIECFVQFFAALKGILALRLHFQLRNEI